MQLSAATRRAALTMHVVSSVGWLGAVLAFLGLAVAAVQSTDPGTARSLYIAMEVLAVGVLVPLSVASLLSGLVQALGTAWGLFRHYWVLIKLMLTVVATAVLLAYVSTLRLFADAARSPSSADDLALLPSFSPVLHSVAAVAVLLAAAGLSIYKPRGVTPHGWRKQQQRRAAVLGPGGQAQG